MIVEHTQIGSMRNEQERRHLLSIPSEEVHERSKITRIDWERSQRAQHDPVQRLLMRRTERQIQDAYDLIQGGKQYIHAPHITLPLVPQRLQCDLGDVLRQRRSVRTFSGAALTLEQLATLLRCGYGSIPCDDIQTRTQPRRTVPSGGGLYVLELYALVLNVEGLPGGAYHYACDHSLAQLTTGDLHAVLQRSLLYAELTVGPAALLVISGVFLRPRFKYGASLSYRLTLLEAGHVGQNICLAATALGLGACPVEGYVEDNINDVLGLDGVEESALYLFVLGHEQR